MKLISLVVPMYNESQMVSLFLKTVHEQIINKMSDYRFEIVAVNDGSKDDTLEILKREQENYPSLVIVDLSRNFGQEGAVHAGLKIASGDAVIPMDADLQDPPSVIEQMVEKWEQGYQVVNATRVSRKKDTAFKRNTAGILYRVLDYISPKVRIPQNVNNFRLLDRVVVDEINRLTESNKVLRIEIPFVGYKTATIEIYRQERAKGDSHYNLKSMVSLAQNCMTSLTVSPLYLSLKINIFLFVMFALSSLTEVVFAILSFNHVLTISEIALWGWLIINILLLLSVVTTLILTLMSIYLGKAVEEAQNRPHYIIKEIIRK